MSAVNTATSEHVAIAEGAGLVDRSERGKLALTGADAKEFLAGQVTNDVVGLEAGDGCYAALLTPKGRMLGDLRVLDTGDELLLDMDRAALQAIFDVIRRATIGFAVELHKRTLQRGLLSLAGPRARDIAGAAALPVTEHANGSLTIGGAEARVIATNVGVDVLTGRGHRRGARRTARGRCRAHLRGDARRAARRDRAPALGRGARRDRRSRRRQGSTTAPSRSRRAATSARRRSRACTGRASRTAICAACS